MFREKNPSKKQKSPVCDLCKKKTCREDEDCFGITEQIMPFYTEKILDLARVASKIEGQFYMQKTRLEEIMIFSQRMGYKKLGVAFCIGLSEEAKILCKFLRKEFDVSSVCCKVCAVEKKVLGLEKIKAEEQETMCNPVGQAMLLNRAETDLNLICGLCIGHDIQFTQYSEAPVTTFIVKDRVLGHNPVVSLYCRYLRKRVDEDEV